MGLAGASTPSTGPPTSTPMSSSTSSASGSASATWTRPLSPSRPIGRTLCCLAKPIGRRSISDTSMSLGAGKTAA